MFNIGRTNTDITNEVKTSCTGTGTFVGSTCPTSKNTMISECAFDKWVDNLGACQACDPSCNSGNCVRAGTSHCTLCYDLECNTCELFDPGSTGKCAFRLGKVYYVQHMFKESASQFPQKEQSLLKGKAPS